MDCSKTYKILFWILLSLILILLIWMFITGKNIINKWKEVYNNDKVCRIGTGKCQITLNDDLTLPDKIDSRQYVPTTAQYCLDIVSRVADMYDHGFVKPPSLTQSFNIISNSSSKKPIIGKIFTDLKNRAWVAFRGTQTLDELLADFNFHEKSISNKHKQVTLGSTENIKVHQGFWEEYKTFRSNILQYFKQNASYDQIIITGHSLGSALAVLLSYDLMNSDQSKKLVVYLFACPRVGNIEFQESYQVPCFSIVNQSDVIPTLPFSVMPNNSHNVNIYSHVGKQITFDDNWKSLGNNHQIPIYATNILKT